jgi:hypothetical protein
MHENASTEGLPPMKALVPGLALAVLLGLTGPAGAAEAPVRICEKFGSTPVAGGRYTVQNNVWGADTRQCLDVRGRSFAVTEAAHANATNGAPAGYPSIYAGCHWSNCTTGSGLPLQVTRLREARSSVTIRTPRTGIWNAAYDLWFDPTPDPAGQNTGAELMVWMDHQGPIQPVGAEVGTARLAGATWDVWFGTTGWNVVTYIRRDELHRVRELDLRALIRDGVRRGYIAPAGYLTSAQFGFEPWQGGAGLAARDFGFRAR